jgi:hypothetical protein
VRDSSSSSSIEHRRELPRCHAALFHNLLAGALLIVLSACFGSPRKAPAPPPPAQRMRPAAPRRVDVREQQHYYDLGLQYYGRDNFRDARTAFQHVIDIGPNTPLAAKALENVKKIDQIMKTLEDIETK